MPAGVNCARPPLEPPRSASTSGEMKQSFIVRMSVQARMYDMPTSAAARAIDPVA